MLDVGCWGRFDELCIYSFAYCMLSCFATNTQKHAYTHPNPESIPLFYSRLGFAYMNVSVLVVRICCGLLYLGSFVCQVYFNFIQLYSYFLFSLFIVKLKTKNNDHWSLCVVARDQSVYIGRLND